MKRKRLLSLLMTLCMTATMLGSLPIGASAADDTPQWHYYVKIIVSTKKDSNCKNGNVKAKFEFESGDEYVTVQNTNKKGGIAYAFLTTTRAPWTLKKLTMENNSKDGFRMRWIGLYLTKEPLKVPDDEYEVNKVNMINIFPNGTNGNDGKWIQTDDGDKPTYSMSVNKRRDINKYGNFSDFKRNLYISSHDESGTESYVYDGMITDFEYGYATPNTVEFATYNCLNMSEPPTVSYTVSGKKGNNASVTKTELKSKGGFTDVDNLGFTIDRKKLMEYMNENNVNHITVTAKLSFPRAETGTIVFNISRNIFAVSDNLRFSSNYHSYDNDNNFYNNTGGRKIDVTATILTGEPYSHIDSGRISGKEVTFDEAYLLVGDTGEKLYCTSKSATITNNCFTLPFEYNEGLDSNNRGLTLVLSGAKVYPNKYGDNQALELWDTTNKKLGLEKYSSEYKIDAVDPTVKFSAGSGTDLSKWNKTISLTAIPSETTFAVTEKGKSAQEGYFNAALYDGNTPVQIRNIKNAASTGAYTEQSVNSMAGSETTFSLALAEKREGIFTLRLTGADIAGNALSSALENIRLDNKAPEVKLERKNANDGSSKSVQYAVKISDASGTGRLYYCFSDSADIPSISSQTPQKHISGEINSLINKWAFIDQADTEGDKGASIYLSVAKGEAFNGRLAWFAVDDFGNSTSTSYEDINIINEDSQCDIDSEQSTLTANPNYTVTVSTNSMNRVYWKWIDSYGADITEYTEYTGAVNTENDIRTSSLDGTYIFKCKLVMPSGTTNYAEKSFVFDNGAPKLNITSPSAAEYKELQTVTVYASDASGVAAAEAVLFNADGTQVDGGIYPLNINDGMVSQNINITEVPSGAYKLKVNMADVHGNSTDDISDVFYIRSAAADVAVSVTSDKEFTGMPLVREASQAKIKINAHEDFAGAQYAAAQSLYCRISTDPTTPGQWFAAGDMTVGESGFDGEFEVDMPQFVFADGENRLYLQMAVCAPNTDMTKLNTKFIATAETTIIFDSAAPQARLVIDDKHTAEAIEGTLFVTDNIGAAVSAECNDGNIEIKSRDGEENVFDITVRENTIDGAYITVTDYAGNSAQIPIDIKGIDRTAPTADISVQTSASGDRIDAKATINVYDAAPDKVQFAFIPENEMETALVNDKINDKYFGKADDGSSVAAVYDDSIIAFATNGETPAAWDDEVNTSYTVRLGGCTGTYYIGVRAQDTVGNTADMILADALTATDAELTFTAAAAPKEADKISVINLEFNQPVYLLSQDKITAEPDPDDPEKTIDETNLEIAARNAGTYSKVHSLVIRGNGEYKLYTVDDIGRKKVFAFNADESLVKFGAIDAGVTAKTFVDGEEVADGEMAGVYTATSDYGYDLLTTVVVTPDDDTMHLMPMEIETDPIYYGLYFSEKKSEQYKTDNGYTKLVYDVTGYKTIDGIAAENGERIFSMNIFAADNTDESTWSTATAIVDNIDNTAPQISYSMTPQLYTIDEYGGIISETTTPQDVTVYITMQDKESGISKITLGGVAVMGYGEEGTYEELPEIPLTDDSGNAIDYSQAPFTWNGEEKGIALTVEYAGDADLYGAKIIKFVFGEDCMIHGFMVTNGVGDMNTIMVGHAESGIDIHGIYKMPIEQGEDFNIKYYYETADGDWEEMTDTSAYCRRAKAVVEPLSRWDERGLYVRNNGGRLERELDSYEKSFTFEFRDKYGYSAEAEVEVENFDITAGTIDYSLSETEKTNVPISLTVNAADGDSGIGKVELVSGNNAKELSGRLSSDGKSGTYFASIDKNGTYSIVLYDKVGNRTAENFTVGNLDTEKPTVDRVEYSVDQNTITSRSVSATLIFSKSNVRITSVEPATGVTEADYSVSYSSNVITFSKSGSVTVNFVDDSGNTGSYPLTVSNIDRTPPSLQANAVSNTAMSEVTVTFDMARTAEGILIDSRRQLSDITVSYGGIAMKADVAKFVIYEKGIYTFKAYDDEGLSSYITLELDDSHIDTTAPVIKEIRWSYDYETDGGTVTAPTKSVTPNKAGYRIGLKNADGTADNHVTNRDVTVTVITDSETRQLGSDGAYATENSKVYSGNGLYIFNMEKKNTLTDTFGVDMEIIDKTPPVIELIGGSELVFYENSATGETYTADKRDRIETPGTAFTASDAFGGGVDLSGKVEVIYDSSHPFDPTGAANVYDSSAPYTVTYRVYDEARNVTEVRRTIRLIGMYDTMALINGELPDSAGTCEVQGDTVSVELKNFSPAGTAYVRRKEGIRTTGQMKTEGTMIAKGADGKYTVTGLAAGWHTFYIQTDKRDYFTIYVYLY